MARPVNAYLVGGIQIDPCYWPSSLSWLFRLIPDRLLHKRIPRQLFLDDDETRGSTFLEANPNAVWVQTVTDCVAKLAETWDEIHLDHDLGGEHFVDVNREDCGMEVVRWLSKEPRRHLRRSRFTIHSHNMAAAFEMALRIQTLGYRVEVRPFGIEPTEIDTLAESFPARLLERARALIRKFRGLEHLSPARPIDVDLTDDDA